MTDFVLCFSLHCGPISGHVKVVLVRVCFNRHVVEMLRLKKGNFSPRSFVYWAFYETGCFRGKGSL